jgi:hypothetical protein
MVLQLGIMRGSAIFLLSMGTMMSAVAVGCASPSAGPAPAVSEANIEGVPEASADTSGPLDRPGPSGQGVRTCGSTERKAKPLQVFTLYPKARTLDLGAGVLSSGEIDGMLAKGDVQRDADNVVASAFGALTDNQDLGGWVGAPTGLAWDEQSNLVPLPGTTKDPLETWGIAQRATMLRMTYSVAWYQREHDFYFGSAERSAEVTDETWSEYVASFAGSRYFGATFGVNLASECAMGALADTLNARPTVLSTVVGEDPRARTLFDPKLRGKIQEVLVRDGAEIYVSIVSNRPRPEVERLLEQTKCSAADLGECDKLVEKLGLASKAISAVVAPSTYDALATDTGDWSVTKFSTKNVGSLP